jgi:hypothetical protein
VYLPCSFGSVTGTKPSATKSAGRISENEPPEMNFSTGSFSPYAKDCTGSDFSEMYVPFAVVT